MCVQVEGILVSLLFFSMPSKILGSYLAESSVDYCYQGMYLVIFCFLWHCDKYKREDTAAEQTR